MSAPASLLPDALAERFLNRRMFEADRPGRVRAALALVTSDEREALELCFFANRTPAEISTRLQMPLGEIEARIGRGLFGFFHAMSLQARASLNL